MITFHGSESGNRIAILDKSSISMIAENSKEGYTEITFKKEADSEYTSLSVSEDFDTVCNTVTLGYDPKLKEDCNEDSNVDVSKYKTTSRTELVENFTSAINDVRAAFYVLMNQNDEVGDRYNKVCAEANMLQTEVEKLKANNNNDLCIQLREEIARLKRDNDTLREDKKVVEANNDSLMIANKSLQEDVQRLKEILKAIKNLTL